MFIEQGVSARNVIAHQIAGQAQTFHVQSGQTVNTNTKDTILIKIWRTGTGSTDYIGFSNSLKVCEKIVNGNLIEKIKHNIIT